MKETKHQKPKCPYCGSEDIAEYIWGEPLLDENLFKALDNKEVILGGCCISDNDPQYHCNKCDKDFGKRKDWQ